MDIPKLENTNPDCSILALREATRKLISGLLNPIKLILTEDHKLRDYRGLAELCGISGEVIRSLTCHADPTSKVLELWTQQSKSEATVANLVNYLEQLDRFDIVDDLSTLMTEDVKIYQTNLSEDINAIDVDNEVITIDDLHNFHEGLEPQHYDAFVLFDDEDVDFAEKLIENLEERKLKLCVKERDVRRSKCDIDSITKLITERCRRVIVILSTAFLRSKTNTFFFNIANSISIDHRCRKIVPCIYKECEKIPPYLNCYIKLDFRRPGLKRNFWDVLYQSIVIPEKPKPKLSLPENNLFNRVDSRESVTQQNAVTRTVPNSEQSLLPADLRLMPSSSSHSIESTSVQFTDSNSTNDLPHTELSENSLRPSEGNAARKRYSIFKKINMSLLSKKSLKNQPSNRSANEDAQIRPTPGPEENKKENNGDQHVEQSITTEMKNKGKDIEEEKKAKKKKFLSLKLLRKKKLVAAT